MIARGSPLSERTPLIGPHANHVPDGRAGSPRRRGRRLAIMMVSALLVASGGARAANAGSTRPHVRITAVPSIAHRTQAIGVLATTPVGWWCQLSATTGVTTLPISRIVRTPHGRFSSIWLISQRATIGRWSVQVRCAPTASGVRAGTTITGRRTVRILVPVPASHVMPALVDITSQIGVDQTGVSAGTGIVLNASGLIVTNNHVVAGATSISIRDIGNRRTYTDVTVVGVDPRDDIAVLQINGARGLSYTRLADSRTIIPGSGVQTIGNAGGVGGTPTVSVGFVTALGQRIIAQDPGPPVIQETLTGLIRMNAILRPGDSGGALIDAAGNVVGINTAALQYANPPIGYAIPARHALSIVKAILSGTTAPNLQIGPAAWTAYLGVAVNNSGQIQRVVVGGPAWTAGIRALGQSIVSVNGQPIASATDLHNILAQLSPETTISLGLSSGGPPTLVPVFLGYGTVR